MFEVVFEFSDLTFSLIHLMQICEAVQASHLCLFLCFFLNALCSCCSYLCFDKRSISPLGKNTNKLSA